MTSKTQRIKVVSSSNLTREDAEQLLHDIGGAQRRVIEIEQVMNDELSAIKKKYEQHAQPHNEDITVKFRQLHGWAESNRDRLLDGKLKTCRLATGEISWRLRPPSVRITQAETVIETLKRLGLSELVRMKEEVAKDLILADPDRVEGVKGISVVSGVEDFVAKPFSSEIERAEPVLRKAA